MGRITMLTKQLDMALSNDIIAQWYAKDFVKRLQLDGWRKAAFLDFFTPLKAYSLSVC